MATGAELLEVPTPQGWRLVPLWALFSRAKVLGHLNEPMLSVFREHGVVLKDSLPNLNKTAEDRSIYQLVDHGWLVVNRMKAFQGSVGVSFQRGIVSGHYICFRPRHEESSRYLNWLLRSDVYRTIYQRLSRGVRPGQIEIDNDYLRNVPVLLPPLDVQRRIADFLDDQVRRIDTVIASRDTQRELVNMRFLTEWGTDARELAERNGLARLRRCLASITDGPFGSSLTAAHYSDAGTRVIRLGNIGRGEFRANDEAFIPSEYGRQLRQHEARSGDLIIAGLGDERWPLGRAAVVPSSLGPAIVKADCYRVRLRPDVTHEFAAWFLSSPFATQQIALLSRGATRARLNTDVVRDAPMVLIDAEQQNRTVDRWRQRNSYRDTLEKAVLLGQARLEERKRSLITAAVTGEFDVSSASSRAADVALSGVGGGS